MEKPVRSAPRIGRAWADYCRRLRARAAEAAMQERQHRERVQLARVRRAMP